MNQWLNTRLLHLFIFTFSSEFNISLVFYVDFITKVGNIFVSTISRSNFFYVLWLKIITILIFKCFKEVWLGSYFHLCLFTLRFIKREMFDLLLILSWKLNNVLHSKYGKLRLPFIELKLLWFGIYETIYTFEANITFIVHNSIRFIETCLIELDVFTLFTVSTLLTKLLDR